MSNGVAILIVLRAIFGIGALIAWLFGCTWAVVILVVGLLLLAWKKPEPGYD